MEPLNVSLSICTRRKPALLPLLLHNVPAHQTAGNDVPYKNGTALLFGGWWRSAYDGPNLAALLLPPLRMPDTLMALTYVKKVDACSSVASCGLKERFALLEGSSSSVRYELEEQLDAARATAASPTSHHLPLALALTLTLTLTLSLTLTLISSLR